MCEAPSCGSLILPQKLFRFTDIYPNTRGYEVLLPCILDCSSCVKLLPMVALYYHKNYFASLTSILTHMGNLLSMFKNMLRPPLTRCQFVRSYKNSFRISQESSGWSNCIAHLQKIMMNS